MVFRKRSDKEFDEFFGLPQRGEPVANRHHPPVPHQPAPADGRGEAVRRRLGADSGSRQNMPPAPQYRNLPPAPAGQYYPPRDAGKASGAGSGGYSPRKGGDTGAGKKAALWIALVLVLAALGALAAFMLRPTDGGDYYRLNGSLPQVEGIRQTRAFAGSVWLDWEPVEGAAGYRICRADSLTGKCVEVKTAFFSWAALGGLEQGRQEEYVILPFCTTPHGEYEETNAAPFVLKTRPAKSGTVDHGGATARSITLEWEPVAGADGYELQRRGSGLFDWIPCGETEAAQITAADLTASCEYTFRVRPYIEIDSGRCYGGWSERFESATAPAVITGFRQGDTTDSGYMLTWTAGSFSTGYELYRADGDTMEPTELLGQCGVEEYQISGLESVTFSSYRVRPFLRHDNGVSYGEFSDPLTAVTLPTKVSGVDQYTAPDGTGTLSWQPAERAEGYEIYAYSCHRNEYTLLAVSDSPSYTLSDLTKYAERYKVRAYISLGDLMFFGDFSEELPCRPYVYLRRTITVDKASTAMRTGAGPDCELIKELPRGTQAHVFAEKTGTDGSRWFRAQLTDGTAGWISREDVTIANTCKTLTTRTYTEEQPIVIYLSPSKQGGNPYIIGNTTEKEQMEAVGAVTHRILAEEYNCVVYTATPELELRERAFEALELKADVYLAIHSNATGGGEVHYGASSYYCAASARSKKLGESLNAHLNAIAPKKCTLAKQMYSALDSFGGVGYAEVRDPYNLGMVAVLVETDFHDNELTARWIMDNHEAIGRALAESLAETFDISKK